MADKILLINKKGEKMSVKLRDRVKNGYSPDSYFKSLNPKDFNDLALLFQDLEMIGAPVEKAIVKFREQKRNGRNPFF